MKSPTTGAMTTPLLALVGLMAVCLILGFQLKESAPVQA